MGLVISAVSKIKESEEAEGHFYVHVVDEFGRHSLPQGWYAESDESRGHGFRAGSYRGYNSFRRDLCEFAHGVSDHEIWVNLEKYKGSTFHEIIDFSDCQGVIGAEVSDKLHQDFVENRESFKEWLYKKYKEDEEMAEYRLEVYDDFTLAFEIAKEDGIVVFC